MKKVLIVTHLVRASPRITGLVKYLPEFGWQPVLITVPLNMGHSLNRDISSIQEHRVIEVPYVDMLSRLSDFLKKVGGFEPNVGVRRQSDKRFGADSTKMTITGFLIRLYKEALFYPDQDKAWKTPAVKAGSQFLSSESVEAIISSSSPVTSHVIAKQLKDKYKLPWIADLRDLWSQNHNYPYGALRKAFDRRLERKTLSTAEALVTVSKPLVERLKILHEGKKVYEVTNGFDPEEMNTTKNSLTAKFTITYTGQIYTGKQDPSKLLQALRELISEGIMKPDDVEVRFYGYEEAWLTREIEKYGLKDVVKQYGVVPRKIALEKQRESQLLLLLNFEDPMEKGTYTLKIFEYLAAKRPILVTGGFDNDVKEKLLTETKAGFYAKVQDVKKILEKTYLDYKVNGEITYEGDEEEINRYSYREMARKFATILDQIIG